MCPAGTGTLQPPLPLHEFLPAHPLSPPEQPPMPLQLFRPLQTCFSLFTAALGAAAFLASAANTRPPATRPATTLPMTFANSLRSMAPPVRTRLLPPRRSLNAVRFGQA